MPADGVMRHGARGFGQNHGERDEHEWLPQLGNLIPDEKSKEGCACGREETAESARSEEHTSELQSQSNLVCRLLLEKKNSPTREHRTSDSDRRREIAHPP